jgi:hypothetical protein
MNELEKLLDGEKLPDDLRWLEAQFRLQPNDPVFLLIVWHWKRVQQSRDVIEDSTQQLRAMLDLRFQRMQENSRMLAAIETNLSQTREMLELKPLHVRDQIQTELGEPIRIAVQTCNNLGIQLRGLLDETNTTLRKARRKRLLASFAAGAVAGGMVAIWIYQHYFLLS